VDRPDQGVVIINLLLGMFAYMTWVERKLLGRMQLRYGPNRAGPFGLLQPIADLVKLIRKESFYPATAVDFLYITAPIVSAFTALLPPSRSSLGARAGTSPATTSRARSPTSRSR
jgi:NADH:ubiquinone oxidoreductase subunit H